MKVKILIQELLKLPQEVEVSMLYDGATRSFVDGVYLARSGEVVVGSSDEPAYHNEDRPIDAPDEDEDPYYKPMERV